MKRRDLLKHMLMAGTGLMVFSGMKTTAMAQSDTVMEDFQVQKTPDEWQEILTDEEYHVLREEGTEPAYSSPLHDKKESGVYKCAGCGQPVYSSITKFDSGTGWPSFYAPIQPDAIGTKTDRKLIFMVRTEVHCSRCGGHLGHIFDDGPDPTEKRHCINGIALDFEGKPTDQIDQASPWKENENNNN
jgi:peptide-methionine (R)-S-oxide reductase